MRGDAERQADIMLAVTREQDRPFVGVQTVRTSHLEFTALMCGIVRWATGCSA